MTEQEFLTLVEQNVGTYYNKPKNEESYDIYLPRTKKCKNKIDLDDVLYVKWCSGGVGGGSCWNEDNSHHAIEGEKEPELPELDALLEVICPNITYLQYKKLIDGLLEYKTWTEYEYYGNSTSYDSKMVSLKNLFQRLKDLKIV